MKRQNNKIYRLTLFTGLFATLHTPAALPNTLCKSDEKTILACNTSPHRGFAFCRSTQSTPQTITYRFGSEANIELTHTSAVGPESDFFYGHYSRYQFNITHIGFNKGKYVYTGFYDYDGEFPGTREPTISSGLYVDTPDGKRTTLTCIDEPNTDHFIETRDLPCSIDSVIGCDRR